MPDDIALSICVPTYNRAAMLRRNLSFHRAAFRVLGLAFEIVVVDDCSTDGTADYLAGLAPSDELQIHRRVKNAGFLDNYAFAMRRARGRYAVFLGDDDLLIPDKVMACVARLDADPGLGMIQAPWLCVDERPGAPPMGPFYQLPAEARFARGNHAALIRFVVDFHVFPEFMIIRRDVLAQSISSACPFIFWAFLYTGRALVHADVLFTPEPFARVTAVSADPRMQQGNTETMFQWDGYRGGVEYLLSLAGRDERRLADPRPVTMADITAFMMIREKVALRLHLNAGNWAEAYLLHHRIAAYEPAPLPPEQFHQVCQLAGITTAVREAIGFSGGPVVVDPLVTDAMLDLLKPELRERCQRAAPVGDAPQAYLRLDRAFPPHLPPAAATFDLSDYIAQFV